jgi:hypothetical protein
MGNTGGMVTAPGYQSQMLSFTLDSPYDEEGCGCLDVDESRDVDLVRE